MAESKANTSVKIFEKWRRRSVADEITVCWICNRDLASPRSLLCLHSFCEECILVLLKTYERRGKLERAFRCPQCKTLVPNYIPEKVCPTWLRMFPTKRSIDNMKDAVNLIEEMCKPCSEKWKIIAATKFCVECQIFLCLSCEADHKAIKENKGHKIVNYELNSLKHTPVANISKFHCRHHKNLRFSIYCETHAQFLCNNCMESGQHQFCRVRNDVIDTVRSITKSESKLHVINHLKHDERNLGKEHVKVIEQIDRIQRQLEELKMRQTTVYCNYVMQATVTDHKTGAMDALKGKLEFDKTHRTHEPVSKTMIKVEGILSEFVSIFTDKTDDKSIRHDIHKSISEIEKILHKDVHVTVTVNEKIMDPEWTLNKYRQRITAYDKTMVDDNLDLENNAVAESQPPHMCKKHVANIMSEDDAMRYSKAMPSVGVINYARMTGTVFRVGTKYVMTAAHIVRDIVDPERTKDSDWAALEEKDVFVGFGGSPETQAERFSVLSQVPFLNDELDVAVLEIKDPDNLPPPLSLSIKVVPEQELTEVSTIGFRHSGQLSKFVEPGCDVIMADSDRAMAAIKWLRDEERRHRCNLLIDGKEHTTVNWNYDSFKDQSRITVDIYTDHRSFGSPVLTKSGTAGLRVVGILNETVPECFSDLPNKLQERFPPEFKFELATKLSHVYNIVATESRCLADDLFLVDERL